MKGEILTVSGWYKPMLNRTVEFEALGKGRVSGKLLNGDMSTDGKIFLMIETDKIEWCELPNIFTGVKVLD